MLLVFGICKGDLVTMTSTVTPHFSVTQLPTQTTILWFVKSLNNT